MKTKLTLQLEKILIKNAKRYAKATGKSLYQVVSAYFQTLLNQDASIKKSSELPPITQALQGILKAKTDENDYQLYLEKKY